MKGKGESIHGRRMIVSCVASTQKEDTGCYLRPNLYKAPATSNIPKTIIINGQSSRLSGSSPGSWESPKVL